MRGILLLLPGKGSRIPTARELRTAGFALSSALAPPGWEPDGAEDRATVEDNPHDRILSKERERRPEAIVAPGPAEGESSGS